MRLPVVWHAGYSIAQPPDHAFPMGKFTVLGAWLLRLDCTVHAATEVRQRDLLAVHHADYLQARATAAVIGGGYDRDLSVLAARHALLFKAALATLAA